MKVKIIRLTFWGAFIFLFPYLLIAQNTSQSYCSLFNRTENYQGKIIKTRALMTYSTVGRVDGGDSFIYSQDCNSGDYFATVDFTNLKNSEKWDKFFAKLPEEKSFIFEINFVGRLQTSITPAFGHLSWSLTEVEVSEIYTLKDVTSVAKIKKPNYKAETPLRDKGKQLENINNRIVFFFFDSKREKTEIANYVADGFMLTDTNGGQYRKDSYQEITFKNLFLEAKELNLLSLSLTHIIFAENVYEVYGTIVNEEKDGTKKTLKYKNVFQYANDSWFLKQTEFSNL